MRKFNKIISILMFFNATFMVTLIIFGGVSYSFSKILGLVFSMLFQYLHIASQKEISKAIIFIKSGEMVKNHVLLESKYCLIGGTQ